MPLHYGIAFRTTTLDANTNTLRRAYQVWDEEWLYLNIPSNTGDKLKALVTFVKQKNAWRVDIPSGLYEERNWKAFPIHQRRQD